MLDLKLKAQFAECDKHLKRIGLAHAKMAAFMPLNAIYAAQAALEEIYLTLKKHYLAKI